MNKVCNGGKTKNKNNDNLKALTIRFTPEVYKQILSLSSEYNVSAAFVARAAIEYGLNKYFESIRYIDKTQGKIIYSILLKWCNINEEILDNIRRIGVNYNQEIRLKHIEERYRRDFSNTYDTSERYKLIAQHEKDKKELPENSFSKKEFLALLKKYEDAAEKEGKMLWHIFM